MIKDGESINLCPVERIIRIILGLLLFYFGLKISTISELVNNGCYQNGTISFLFANIIARYQNIFRILGWFLGFVLVFTGANGFSPTYKLLHINTNRRRLFK